ncbi:MAG: undecaprenyldiphospho-muramoylpentapeptide beta-N-acetylglucosaminyltransferase [Patescibacteria group bacterium]|nr:undecaprenyldiphospho-muramoylpentapeptide beta-N-acetylglucosaminyltransferase [Patescibacteria group bacterium]
MRVIVTGGHLTPALATIQELKKQPNIEIIFIGRKSTIEGDKTPSAESTIIPKMGIKFIPLTTGRLQRRFTRYTIPSLLKIPFGFAQALKILLGVKPDVILSFGGYLAVPVVVAGKALNIPVITHEQTVESGLANKIIARFANKVAISWEQSLKHFPSKKAILTGNPVREEMFNLKRVKTMKKLIYVTGGNQGSHVINETLLSILPDLLDKYEVTHQTGSSEVYKDFEMAKAKYLTLPKRVQEKYKFAKWFEGNEVAEILSKASLVIGRSGANMVCELAIIGVPAIFIPLPYASHNEQTKNAQVLEQIGAAVILPQRELTAKRLLAVVEMIMEKFDSYQKKAKEAKKLVPKDGARRLVEETLALGNKTKSLAR